MALLGVFGRVEQLDARDIGRMLKLLVREDRS